MWCGSHDDRKRKSIDDADNKKKNTKNTVSHHHTQTLALRQLSSLQRRVCCGHTVGRLHTPPLRYSQAIHTAAIKRICGACKLKWKRNINRISRTCRHCISHTDIQDYSSAPRLHTHLTYHHTLSPQGRCAVCHGVRAAALQRKQP